MLLSLGKRIISYSLAVKPIADKVIDETVFETHLLIAHLDT